MSLKLPGLTFSSVAFCFQVTLLIIFAIFVDYEKTGAAVGIQSFYPVFQDVHVMIFIGFGFLMTFLRKYGFGAVGYNLYIAAVIVQWATIINAWLHNAASDHGFDSGDIAVSVKTLITSDFAAAAVLITFGAVLGKVSRLQLLVIGIIEVVFYAVNETILAKYLKVTDVGGSMVIHMFGAYFGLSLARVLKKNEWLEENDKEGSNYHSDLFAMVGTVFLWMFWPSFNGALLGPGEQQSRAFINTYFSLAACCMMTFVISPLVNKNYKLSMVHVQNATLAGGVAVGTMADLAIKPWGAILVGMVAGTVSTIGYAYITPFLVSKLKLHDTCGVHNLHGMPALIAGIGGAIAAAVADDKDYGTTLNSIWPAIKADGRSKGEQAGYQFLAVIVTLGMSIAGGAITALIVTFLDTPKGDDIFDDERYWELENESQYFAVEKTDLEQNDEVPREIPEVHLEMDYEKKATATV